MASKLPLPTVSVLGTGRMGSAIARRLADHGYKIILWNRTKHRAEDLASEINAEVASTPIDAIQRANTVFLALSDDLALYSVISTFRRIDGLVVVNTGTHQPFTVSNVKEYLENNGGCYIESPIIGGPKTVLRGEAILLVAGEQHCVGSAQSILEKIGSIIYLGNDPRTAQALKLSFNLLLINTVNALAESLNLAEAYGVDKHTVKKVLEKTVFSTLASKYIDRMTSDPEKPASFRLKLAAKDLAYAVYAGFEKYVSLPATAATLEKYLSAVESGLGDADYTRIFWLSHKRSPCDKEKDG